MVTLLPLLKTDAMPFARLTISGNVQELQAPQDIVNINAEMEC
jgi:hypothetical protein